MALRIASVNDLPPHLRAQAIAQTSGNELTEAQRSIQRVAAKALGICEEFYKNTPTRNGKMDAQPTTRTGIRFHSKLEDKRFDELTALRAAGEIVNFHRQVIFDLGGIPNVTYRVDFMIVWADGRVTYEDVKGYETESFIMKRKLVRDRYGVEIELVKRPARKPK